MEEKDEEYQKTVASLNQALTKALDAGKIPKSKFKPKELKEMWDDDNQWQKLQIGCNQASYFLFYKKRKS